jgi:hypothetical protein
VFDPACVHHPWYSVGAGAAEACREIYRAGPVRIVNWDYGSWFFQLVARGSLDVDARDGNMTMALRLRRLTEREHRLCAPLLAFVVTFIFADMALPRGAQLRMAGHTTIAMLETTLPFALFVLALLVLSPRTGNESEINLFRFFGRFPLLVRYFAVILPFGGIQAGIDKLFG